MDQEQLREFEEQLRTLSSVIAQASQIQSSAVSQMQRSLGISRQETQAKQEGTKATEDLTQSTGKLTAAQKATIQANREHQDAMRNAVRAAEQFSGAMGTLTKTVLDTNRTFGKYGDTFSQVGDAAQTLGKNFGLVGQAAGFLVKALTFVAEKSLEQADNLVTATDSLRRMGAQGEYTSGEFLTMAHASGVVSKNLELLVKPMQDLSTGLVGLGSTVGQGVERFTELTAVTAEQRMQFRRLGIDQEELIESQAAYLQLQNATGRRMQANFRSTDQLQKASLDYTRNLVELAALTGKDIDQIKKEQQAVQAREEFMIRNSQTEREIARLREQGAHEEADRLENELRVRDRFVTEISTRIGDADLDTAIMQMITSGGAVFTEETAALARQLGMSGESFERFRVAIEEGDEGVIDDFLNTFKKSVDMTIDNLGDAAIFGGAELRKAFLMSSETMTFAARRAGESEEEARARVNEQLARAGARGFDVTMDARAQLTELEIKAGVAMDKLLASVNPLIGGFSGLMAATVAATVALGAFSARAAFGGVGGRAAGAVGRVASVARAGINPANISRGARIGVGAGAGVVAGGVAAYRAAGEGRERREDIDRRRETGMLSEEEARAAQRASTARTAGQAAGGLGGALAGGAKGAAMGAALGPVGAVIGGMIGAGLGAWAGSAAGSYFGGAVGELIGESISIESVEEDLVNLNAELELMRLQGASEEEIANKQAELQLTEMLGRALEEGNGHRAAALQTELQLLKAQKDAGNIAEQEREIERLKSDGKHEEARQLENKLQQNKKLIEQLENQAVIQAAMVNESNKLAQAEALLARAREQGASDENLANIQKEVDRRREALEHTQNHSLASQRLLDIDKQISEQLKFQALGIDNQEQIDALNRERTLRNELLEQYSELEQAEQELARTQQTRDGDGQKRAQARIDAAKEEIETRERSLRMADLEAEREEAGFFRRRRINREMRELENLSQPSIGSDQTEEGGVQSTQVMHRAEISGFSRAAFHAANPEAFAEFEEYRKEAQEQLMQGYLDNLSDETKERMEEDPRFRRQQTQLARRRAENRALILAADKFQTEIEEATGATIDISEGYSDMIQAEIEGFGEDAEDLNEAIDLEEQKNRALDLAKTVANGLISVTPFGIFNRIRDRFDNEADEQEQEVIETLENSEISYDDIEESNELDDISELKSSSLELAKSIANGLNALSPKSIFSSMVDRFRRKRDQEEDEVEGIVGGIDEVTVDEATSSGMNSVLSGIQERTRQRAMLGNIAEVPFPESQPFNISPDISSPANQLNEVQQQLADELDADQTDLSAKFLEEMVELQKAQVEMFGRLEALNQEMVGKLDEGNEVSDQILKHSY